MLQLMRRLLPEIHRPPLLDLGCGAGGFLLEARKAGFEVMGVEVSHELAEHVRAVHGVPVFEGLISEPAFKEEKFDVIVSSQVFEHLVNPVGTLEDVARHLKPPGVLLIEVPNLHDIRERLRRGSTMDDAHLFYFTRKSLERMVISAGFRVLVIQDGLRPFRLLKQPTRVVPSAFITLFERFSSLMQIKTGLSAIALLPG